MIRILTALGPYGKSAGIRNAQRLRAFVLVLRYSGLRIGDAVQLDVSRIADGKLLAPHRENGDASLLRFVGNGRQGAGCSSALQLALWV
jgi:hypothetical protein